MAKDDVVDLGDRLVRCMGGKLADTARAKLLELDKELTEARTELAKRDTDAFGDAERIREFEAALELKSAECEALREQLVAQASPALMKAPEEEVQA